MNALEVGSPDRARACAVSPDRLGIAPNGQAVPALSSTIQILPRGGRPDQQTGPPLPEGTGDLAVSGSPTHDLLDILPWPAILLDRQGNVIATSDEHRRSGQPEAPGQPDSLRTRLPLYRAALDGQAPWPAAQQADLTRMLPTGDVVHERLHLRPTGWGACLIVVDETDLKRLQTADVQMSRLAALGFMIAGVCHEISNPLTSIHSNVQLLKSEKRMDAKTLARGLDSITANVKRILDIARRLTTFSKAGEGMYMSLAVDGPINDALSVLRQQGWLENIELQFDPDPGAVVLGHAGQVREVFLNLFLNALQAMGGAGRLAVATRRQPSGMVEVTVRDSGPGFAAELASRIFEPFFTTKPSEQGTGLGLAISDQLVREHGGAIWAESVPGQGATFHVELPQGRP